MSREDDTARRSLLHNRNFMLLWGGQLVSWVGTEVTGIALPLLVLALTGSPATAGLVAAERSAIYVLLALPAGTLLDRWDRRRVMVLANAGSGIALGSICVALLVGHLSVALLFLACAVEGACFVFANLARFTALRHVVPPADYPAAVAQNSMADHLALLLGPPLGGFLYQLAGAGAALLVDVCSYVVNAFSVFAITIPFQEPRERAPATLATDIRLALRWVWSQPVLRQLNLLSAGRIAVTSGLYLLIIVLARHDHASSAAIGGIFAVSALGGILGAAAAGRLYHRLRARTVLWVTTGVTWILVTCYLAAANVFLITMVTAGVYCIDPLFEIALRTRTNVDIPDAIRGRVLSVFRVVELGSYSLGFSVTGLLLQYAGSGAAIGCLAGILFVLTLFAKLNPAFRGL
ncbi:MAG TPA: MFS transporter [Chloroflexota bacterium]